MSNKKYKYTIHVKGYTPATIIAGEKYMVQDGFITFFPVDAISVSYNINEVILFFIEEI